MTLFQSWGFLGRDYPGVWEGTPIFSYTLYVKVQSITFGSKFQKSNTFGSMKICGYFFFFFWGGGGGSLRNQTFFKGGGVISIHFTAFKVKIKNGNIFLAAKFQIFFGMPDIPKFFFFFFFFFFLGGGGGLGVNSNCWVQAYV